MDASHPTVGMLTTSTSHPAPFPLLPHATLSVSHDSANSTAMDVDLPVAQSNSSTMLTAAEDTAFIHPASVYVKDQTHNLMSIPLELRHRIFDFVNLGSRKDGARYVLKTWLQAVDAKQKAAERAAASAPPITAVPNPNVDEGIGEVIEVNLADVMGDPPLIPPFSPASAYPPVAPTNPAFHGASSHVAASPAVASAPSSTIANAAHPGVASQNAAAGSTSNVVHASHSASQSSVPAFAGPPVHDATAALLAAWTPDAATASAAPQVINIDEGDEDDEEEDEQDGNEEEGELNDNEDSEDEFEDGDNSIFRFTTHWLALSGCPPPTNLLLLNSTIHAEATTHFYDAAVLKIDITRDFKFPTFFEDVLYTLSSTAYSPLEKVKKVHLGCVWDTEWLRDPDPEKEINCSVYEGMLQIRADAVRKMLGMMPALREVKMDWMDSQFSDDSVELQEVILARFFELESRGVGFVVKQQFDNGGETYNSRDPIGRLRMEFEFLFDHGYRFDHD
ncbi:hypothetical protein K402DRAFT_463645 [Aulographum hederae CBS 113979]|uniref:Uncharacterized protein n=1 Tax=Aulographum hederae CBS 113979 TaxID=1176131 RepID=A0A6G1GZW8_9PEZI|nr:hypothetical protein K402DRAFT_463645 [Aulographum hederae CBS 113979]